MFLLRYYQYPNDDRLLLPAADTEIRLYLDLIVIVLLCYCYSIIIRIMHTTILNNPFTPLSRLSRTSFWKYIK